MKRLISLFLALVMLLCCAAFGVAAEEELPVVTIFAPESGNVEYPYDLEKRPVLAEITKIARERFGLELKLETAIGSEFTNVMNTRFAAGTDLPGIVAYNGNFTAADLINFYNQGLILDVGAFDMPNYKAAIEAYPGLATANMDADGHLLAVAQVVVNPQHITMWLGLRLDWLEELKLEAPTTPDELYDVLKAFQDNDMNGDSIANESIPGGFEGMNQVLYPAFGKGRMFKASESWWADENGKVYNTYTSDEAKEYVSYVAKLFSEGLLWEQFFAEPTGEEQTQKRIDNSTAGMFSMFWDGLLWCTEANGYGLKAGYAPVMPMNEQILVTNYAGGMRYLITSACPEPEKVAAFLDWFYTDEGTQMSYYGEVAPGGNYYVRDTSSYDSLGLNAASYEMIATDKYYEELATETNLNQKLGANSSLFPQYMPGTADQVAADFYFGYDADVCGKNCDIEYTTNLLNWAIENGTYDLMFVAASAEQADALAAHSDLFNYMDEKYKAFMSGADSLDNWDDFIAQCETMGLSAVTEVMQARYDAYEASK